MSRKYKKKKSFPGFPISCSMTGFSIIDKYIINHYQLVCINYNSQTFYTDNLMIVSNLTLTHSNIPETFFFPISSLLHSLEGMYW